MDTKQAVAIAAQEAQYYPLKEDQATSIEKFISGNDVFVVLPTGYGKSACYACIPRLLKSSDSSIIVVVSPLTALIIDHFTKQGISAGYIDKDSTANVKEDVDTVYSL